MVDVVECCLEFVVIDDVDEVFEVGEVKFVEELLV